MKKTVITAALVLITCLTSYPKSHIPNRIEITNILPAIMIGIDHSEDDAVTATLLIQNVEDDEGSAEGGYFGDILVKSETAATTAQALDTIKASSSKVIPTGSIECFLLGEDAAKSDLYRHIDYISKDNSLNLSACIMMVKGGRADELIALAAKENAYEELYIFEEKSAVSGVSSAMSFLDLLYELCEEHSAFAMPTVFIESTDEAESAVRAGYAIFTDGQFSCYINPPETRAYNIILNKAVKSIIEVPVENGTAAFITEDTSAYMEFRFNGDTLAEITVRAMINSDAQDTSSIRNIKSANTIARIQQEQIAIVKGEMESLVALSQAYKSDFLKIGTQLRLQHPYKWAKIEGDWADILASTPVTIDVEVHMQRTLDMIELEKDK